MGECRHEKNSPLVAVCPDLGTKVPPTPDSGTFGLSLVVVCPNLVTLGDGSPPPPFVLIWGTVGDGSPPTAVCPNSGNIRVIPLLSVLIRGTFGLSVCVPHWQQPVLFTNELQSVHSGTVGLSSCVPTEIQLREQKFSVTMLCWHCETVHLMLSFLCLLSIEKASQR